MNKHTLDNTELPSECIEVYLTARICVYTRLGSQDPRVLVVSSWEGLARCPPEDSWVPLSRLLQGGMRIF